VNELDAARRQIELLQVLSDATAGLGQAATPEEVVTVVLGEGMRALGADGGFVGIADEPDEPLHVVRLDGASRAVSERFDLPRDAPYPLAAALRRSEALFIGSNDELSCDFPDLQRISPEDHACATVPLRDGSRLLGSLNISFGRPRTFAEDEKELVLELARRCAQAMARAERYAEAVRARHAAETEVERLRALDLNDDVVQELAVAKLALESGLPDLAHEAVGRALASSKRVLADMSGSAQTFRRESPQL
jgi:GAF domain-containing protein